MLNQDYKEMLSLLLANKVEFLLVGAYALAAYGFPRATADIDIFVKPSPENATRLFTTLEEFGAPTDDVSVNDFVRPGIILQIGVAPRRIDIITQIDGLSFDEAAQGKEMIELEGLLIPLIQRKSHHQQTCYRPRQGQTRCQEPQEFLTQ